ncbi:hypothetical protein NC651_003540 [Populus alba x Populus x berolinensis]|nr:hypothetical protein NC651_003540 [Populus alba x Populus x berolinensis]
MGEVAGGVEAEEWTDRWRRGCCRKGMSSMLTGGRSVVV